MYHMIIWYEMHFEQTTTTTTWRTTMEWNTTKEREKKKQTSNIEGLTHHTTCICICKSNVIIESAIRKMCDDPVQCDRQRERGREKDKKSRDERKNNNNNNWAVRFEKRGTLSLEFQCFGCCVFLSLFWSHYVLLHNAHRFYFNHNKIIYALHKIYTATMARTHYVYMYTYKIYKWQEIGHHFDLFVVIVVDPILFFIWRLDWN